MTTVHVGQAHDLSGELAGFRRALLADIRAMLEEVRGQHKEVIDRHESLLQCALGLRAPYASEPAEPGRDFEQPDSPRLWASNPSARCDESVPVACLSAGVSAGIPSDSFASASQPNGDGRASRANSLPQAPLQMRTMSKPNVHGHSDDPDNKEQADDSNIKLAGGALDVRFDLTDLDEEEYDVENFYKTTGLVQKVARSEHFHQITLAVISCNAVYIGVDADNNKADTLSDAHWPYQVCEHFFAVFFCSELLIRYVAFRRTRDCLKDGWFRFDAALVFLMVAETWITPYIGIELPTGPLRLLRLLRLSRLVRLMRSLPELITMIKGMRVASRAVGSSLLMVLLLVYVFGIIIHMALKDEPELHTNFETLPLCMWTLLMDGTFMDSTGSLLTKLLTMGKFNTIVGICVFMCFILLSAMTVMNMLIGVLCEVVSAVAQNERDEAAIRLVKNHILTLLKEFDIDGNGKISENELAHVMKNPQALSVLRTLQVDVGCLKQLQQMAFETPESEVPIKAIMDLLLMYRGDLPPTVKHMVELQTFNRWYLTDKISGMMDGVTASFETMYSELATMSEAVGQQAASQQRVAQQVVQLTRRQAILAEAHATKGHQALQL